MLTLSYDERNAAKIAIANVLQEHAWYLFGLRTDVLSVDGDPLPAFWHGVAINANFPGVVLCVAVSDYTRASFSDQNEVRLSETFKEAPCEYCEASGIVTRSTGLMTCPACGGNRSIIAQVPEFVLRWPKFSSTSSDCDWHLEIDGRRAASGNVPRACTLEDPAARHDGAEMFVGVIEIVIKMIFDHRENVRHERPAE